MQFRVDTSVELNDVIEAFENAHAATGRADLAHFLPAPDHPHSLAILAELIRVDMEYGWKRGEPTQLDAYLRRFPQLQTDNGTLEGVAFEEYRLRLQAGHLVSMGEYRRKYRIDTSSWGPQDDSEVANLLTNHPLSITMPTGTDATPPTHAELTVHGSDGGPSDELLISELSLTDPQSAHRVRDALKSLPVSGQTYLGFHLKKELGRGAFGRVYLANQKALANREVALKVSAFPFGESQLLAQLQHTNIVPIYSVHQANPHQAVCMPYFGSSTLAHFLEHAQTRPPQNGDGVRRWLESRSQVCSEHDGLRIWSEFSYERVIMDLLHQLAAGLAHAHERGILHRDLKPANVLITDHGQPMLLDFNLSADTKSPEHVTAAFVGGTLPYMSPEHLEALQGKASIVDARSDIYSLGILMHQLLTLKHPFPVHTGSRLEILPRMIADRARQPAGIRNLDLKISTGTEAIVSRCLQPDPGSRYQLARDLEEDLRRQIQDEPLRFARESYRERLAKFVRRHPNLSSSLSIALVSILVVGLLLGALYARGRSLERFHAQEGLEQFQSDWRALHVDMLNERTMEHSRLARHVRDCEHLLARYHVFDRDQWLQSPAIEHLPEAERDALLRQLGEILLLGARLQTLEAQDQDRAAGLESALAWNDRALIAFGANAPAVAWRQRAEILRLLDRAEQSSSALARAESSPIENKLLQAQDQILQGRYRDALPILEEAARAEPDNLFAWFDLATCLEGLKRHRDAAACFTTCLALRPELDRLYFRRGTALLRVPDYAAALRDLNVALELADSNDEKADIHFNRALALQGLNRTLDALAELDRANVLGYSPARLLQLRIRILEKSGDSQGAANARLELLGVTPTDDLGWLARAQAKYPTDVLGCLADTNEALRLNPRSIDALQNKAHLMSEHARRPEDAVKVLNTLLHYHPDSVPGRAGRAVLQARLGRRAEALRDAKQALDLDRSPGNLYQIACVYALTSRSDPADQQVALRLLRDAVRGGYGLDLLATDSDLQPLRELAEFKNLLRASQTLRP